MPRASVLIQVDTDGKMGMQFQGDESQLLALLGAIDTSKAALTERVRAKIGPIEWEEVETEAAPGRDPSENYRPDLPYQKHNHYSAEVVEVDRDTALQAYYLAYETVRRRMNAIQSAEPTSTFKIPTILSQI